ncbi:protein kinase domain-containing protein [Tundrisphaera lichenicola]|uniref:serine/threonine-protein kinase n=1 Tax=Tundrisphaera lichenicola TaxID=2029860 RepID=UPI003EBC3A16
MLEPKASRFRQAALQSTLIDEAALDACWEQIPPEKRTPDAIDRRLARQTITSGKLTLWQAQQILAGRSNGYRIDKYVLLDLLGRGGMGRVYLARDLRLNRLVALKILSQERMNNPRAITRFLREAKVGAQLQHENLVRVYDEGESGGIRYLVMEYIEGKNVGQVIGELGSIPWPTAARLARQVALGLEHARLKDLIHRDVNPCNILITKDGTAKLTDLGLAIDLNDTDNVTRDGATVGTFDYVSPEQARHSRSVDTRADLYSLGCTIFHMIAGRVPFPVASLPEKLYAHQLHDPEPLTDLVPGVPEGLSEVVRKMMRKLPEERYQTPLEVAQALELYALEGGGWTSAPIAASSTARARTPPDGVRASSPTEVVAVTPAPGDPGSWASSLNPGPETEGTSASGSKPSPSNPSGTSTLGGGGDSFLPLDLGPREPLLASRKPAPRPRKPLPPIPAHWKRRGILIAVGVAALVLAVVVVATLARLALTGPGFANGPKVQPDGTRPTRSSQPLARGDIVVRLPDGSSQVIKTLPDAIKAASNRSGGEVILGPGTTCRISSDDPIRIPDGSLTLRAADGARPVLEIQIKGNRPMFLVNAPLKIQGLMVVVRYETPSEAPSFQAERDLTFENCVFRAIGPAEGSRFALAEGRSVSIVGCLFEGFETTLDAHAGPGMTLSLKESIFLSPRPAEEATGRALRVRSMFGQGAGARLTVEHCSFRSGTFLDVGDFKPASPLAVEVNGSAFLVKTLLGLEGDEKSPIGPDSAIRWKANAARYRVTDKPWATFPDAPADFDAWVRLTGEAGGKVEDLRLAKEPPDPTTPRDCALLGEDGQPAGADPAKVGPK